VVLFLELCTLLGIFKKKWTYLSTKLEIYHHNRDLRARHDKDQIHKEQESKEVVKLVFPNGSEDEEQLDEDCTEGQNAGHQSARILIIRFTADKDNSM
jgi:hypothetical protein